MLFNETPYLLTKPDRDALIFKGDKFTVMREVDEKDARPCLLSLRQKLKKSGTIKLGRNK